jgi:thymidylate synthase
MKSIHITERLLPFAWQEAVIRCWYEGTRFRTEYDKPDDPESRDVLCVIHVAEPFAEPRIHRAFPGGLNDLEKYRGEVLDGVHDHWVDPAQGKWQYTYHQRLFEYEVPGVGVINQIDAVVEKLRETGHTRRAQAVTWQAWKDVGIHDPACLQRLWFRLEQGRLNMVAHMRSNDAFKAAFMNMYAFTELQRRVADRVGVACGEYVHVADSFHIYGSYFKDFEAFLQVVSHRSKDDLCYETAFAREFFIDGVKELLAEADMPQGKQAILRARLKELGGE